MGALSGHRLSNGRYDLALDSDMNVTNALQAYGQASRSGAVSSQMPEQEAVAPQGSPFAQLVSDGLSGALDKGKASEQLAISSITQGADMAQLVLAVSEAELTLQTVVAVRDKVVEAYREILRMPI